MSDLITRTRAALTAAGITGPHQSHSRRNMVAKIDSVLAGDTDDTFGLSGLQEHTAGEILGFVAALTGCSPDPELPDEYDAIDPDATIAGIVDAARRLSTEARRGASLLACTGHPTGLIEHHIRVVDVYRRAGGKILRPREDEHYTTGSRFRREIRYTGNVGCLSDWGNLLHTHSAEAMEWLLESEPRPDIVLGDHGFAGAAIERGIATIAIMDVNDPALAVAWAEGKDVVIVPMDDNRLPRLYEPAWSLFEAVIDEEGELS